MPEISSQLFRTARLVHLHQLFDFVCEFCSESFIFGGDLNVLLLEIDELLVDGLKSAFKFLNFGFVGVKEGDEGEFILMEHGVRADGVVELVIFVSGFDVELGMQTA